MTNLPTFESNRVMLLTGAGFSANFGCPLAKEMWAWIFNDPSLKDFSNVRKLLKNYFDYESVIHKVRMEDGYNSDEKAAIEAATNSAYDKIDGIIENWRGNSPAGLFLGGLRDFLAKFDGDNGRKGFIFTLNQDLLLERHYGHDTVFNNRNSYANPILPGFAQALMDARREGQNGGTPINHDYWRDVPNDDEMASKLKTAIEQDSFFYLKLHGSYRWRHGDNNKMIIGGQKEEQIKRVAILQRYFEIFENAICQGDRKLLVIGYGFRDEHINKVIIKAIQSHGLKVYIVSPQSPSDWKNQGISPADVFSIVWEEGLGGYFPWDLKRVFPIDQSKTQEHQRIISALF